MNNKKILKKVPVYLSYTIKHNFLIVYSINIIIINIYMFS